MAAWRRSSLLGLVLVITLFLTHGHCAQLVEVEELMMPVTLPNGNIEYVPNDRKPSLYTSTFGDCLGNSQIDLTTFYAAYYQDNMTVLFHIDGTTDLVNQSLMS